MSELTISLRDITSAIVPQRDLAALLKLPDDALGRLGLARRDLEEYAAGRRMYVAYGRPAA